MNERKAEPPNRDAAHLYGIPKEGDECPACGGGRIYRMSWATLCCDHCHNTWPRTNAK